VFSLLPARAIKGAVAVAAALNQPSKQRAASARAARPATAMVWWALGLSPVRHREPPTFGVGAAKTGTVPIGGLDQGAAHIGQAPGHQQGQPLKRQRAQAGRLAQGHRSRCPAGPGGLAWLVFPSPGNGCCHEPPPPHPDLAPFTGSAPSPQPVAHPEAAASRAD